MTRLTLKSLLLLSAALVLILPHAQPCLAASTITISSSGNGVYVLQGTDIEEAAAAEISVGYDGSSLTNPRVTQGALMSGALMAVNANAPGTVRIAMVTVHPVTGSGVIATLSFDITAGSSGNIRSLNAKLANIDGLQLAVAPQVISPPNEPTGPASAQQAQPGSPGSATGVSSQRNDSKQADRTQGVVIVASAAAGATQEPAPAAPTDNDEQPSSEKPAAQEERAVLARKESPSPDKGETQVRKVHAHKSTLDRFREFKGTPSVDGYLSLLDQDNLLGFRQEPVAALSDGSTRVKLIFISTPGQRSMSDIALAGAKLISLNRDPDNSNSWIAEILPAKGELSASLSIPQGNMIVVYPLTIAPAMNVDLDKSGRVTKADFDLFQKERGSGKTPKFDLNRDGKRDYIDDYIFTVNYLITTVLKSNKFL